MFQRQKKFVAQFIARTVNMYFCCEKILASTCAHFCLHLEIYENSCNKSGLIRKVYKNRILGKVIFDQKQDLKIQNY